MTAFDARRAYEYACAVARPRKTGSPGEATAVEYISERLRDFGLNVREDPFSFSTALRWFMKLTILAILLALLLVFFLFFFNPFLVGVLVTLLLFLVLRFMSGIPFVATLRGLLFRDVPLFGRQESKNIVATLHNGGGGIMVKRPHVYVLAHYDSKSQSIPLIYRMVFLGVFYFGTVYMLCHYILAAMWWGAPGGWLYAAYCLVNFSGILLLTMVEDNYSPGAIDNASGVGVLLRVAEIFCKNPEKFKDVDITFVATGAEEEGLVGAFHLSKSLTEDSVDKDNCYFINLDSVGLKGKIYCTHKIGTHLTFTRGQGKFVKLVKEAGKEEGIEVKTPLLVLGVAFDHFPLVYEGFNAVTLSTVSKKAKVVHTNKDGIDQLELEGFDRVGRLVLKVIEEIERQQG